MIGMPKRSVTRFFIPLVDVMMLLFSMFLLMPMMQGGDGGTTEGKTSDELAKENRVLNQELDRLKKQVTKLSIEVSDLRKLADPQVDINKLKKEIDNLQKLKMEVLKKRLFVQVLTYDPNRKDLVFYDLGSKPKTIVITNNKDADQIIKEHQQLAKQNGKELFYLMLIPVGTVPQKQILNIENWFREVPFQLLPTPP